jgi:hypothetical protein
VFVDLTAVWCVTRPVQQQEDHAAILTDG